MEGKQSVNADHERNRQTIQNARKISSVSQVELAKRLSVHWITISRLERGLIPVTNDWVLRISRALKMDPDGLILSAMREKGFMIAGTIRPENKVRKSRKTLYVHRPLHDQNEESHWYVMESNDWRPIARQGDIVRFSKPNGDDWSFAVGLICIAQSKGKSTIVCGLLKSDAQQFQTAERQSFRIEDMSGTAMLRMPFDLVGVATTIMYINPMMLLDGHS